MISWLPGTAREQRLVAIAIALGIAVRLVFVAATEGHLLMGDEVEYNIQAAFFADGKFWWSTTPFGIPHESLWKAPGYPLFAGLGYELVGSERYDRLFALQALLITPLIVAGTWLLARRIAGERVAVWAAFGAALYPFIWIWQVRLFSETIALPVFLALMLVVLGREPTPRRAAGAGALVGALLLIRPALVWVVAGVAFAWIIASGWRRGLAFSGLTVAIAVLVVAPWTIRNYVVDDHAVVPISVQDAAAYGTFNDEAANDDELPWAWRPAPRRDVELFRKRVSDAELRSKLQARARDYISDHPTSVLKAAYWNGLRRTWELRPWDQAVAEGRNQGRPKWFTDLSLPIYYVLLALALYGFWTLRHRREIVLPLAAMVATSFFVYASVSSTRSRAAFEFFLLIGALISVETLRDRLSRPREDRAPGPTPPSPRSPAPG